MKAQQIYDITMALMDEMKNDGTVDINSTKDYLARTPGILTILQTEIVIELRKHGIETDTLDIVKNMNAEIDLEDDICTGVIPYGLAARLLGQEDASLSNYFSSLYESKKSDSASTSESKVLAKQETREDVYSSTLRAGD